MLHLPERIHKRPFVVAVIVIALFIIASAVILITLGFFGAGSNLVRVHIYSAVEGSTVNGVGINLSYIPTTNLLENPSFEDTQLDQIYTVFEGTENTVYVLPDSETDARFEDGFFVGGTVRVMSIDEGGHLVQKLQASVTDFQMNQLGLWTSLATPSGTKEDQIISSISSSSRLSVAFGDQGLVISDVTSSIPAIVDLGITEDIAASSCISDRFFAVSVTGDFVTSSDGKTWNLFTPDFIVPSSIHTVSSIGKIGIAAGDQGQILLCSEGKISTVASGISQDILSSAGDGNVIILGCSGGKMLTTSNGVFFRELSANEMPSFEVSPNWQCSDYRNGQFVFGGDQGQIAVGSYSTDSGFSFEEHQANDPSGNPIKIQKMVLLPSGEMIIMDVTGFLYCSKDQGDTWNFLSTSSINGIDAIGLSYSGKILLSQGVSAYSTQLYTRIEFDDVQSENVFQAGDMCFLQCSVPSENGTISENSQEIWQTYGEETISQVQKKAPSGGGSSSLHIVGGIAETGDQSHYVSQVIAVPGDSCFLKNQFYQIEVWLRQDGISNGEVMAWISGNFPSVGTTFTDVGTGWRQYTFTFVLPSDACDILAGEIRLNIGFIGEGELSIDRTYLGLDKYSAGSIPNSFTEKITKAGPSLIRLENLGIGQMGVSTQDWLLSAGNEGISEFADGYSSTGCTSLETSLSLVRSAGGDPWIVIGSAASQTTIEDLMAYLCGSISDPLGKLRIENGTSVPWGMQFDRLVIEISDSDGVFATDLQRGAYVDYTMNVIKSSPFYLDIKGRIVFVDGMVYDGGTMQSEADYHASDLLVSNQKQTISSSEMISLTDAVSEGYTSYFDMIPRTPSRPQEGGEEWIRSAVLSKYKMTGDDSLRTVTGAQITAADFCEMMLSDLGDHTSTVLYNLPVSKNAEDVDTDLMFSSQGSKESEKLLSAKNSETLLTVCALLGDIASGTTPVVKIMPPLTPASQGNTTDDAGILISDGLTAYAFKDQGKIHLIVINTSDQPALFLLEADWTLNGAYAYRYSSEGKFVQKNKLGRQTNRINLLAGQVVIVEMNAV